MITNIKEYSRQWEQDNKDKRREINKRYYDKMKAWFDSIKSKLKCVKCGENHPATLDFHHKDPSTKEFAVSYTYRRFSKEKILKEIEKCVVLCANCHRIHHYETRK